MNSVESITKKLNKEYENIGTVTIKSLHEESIPINNIKFIGSIMEYVEPLDVDLPIIVAKKYSGFTIIDGYHRMKHKINEGIKEVECLVLDDYSIERSYTDDLFDIISSLVGKTIKFVDDYTFILDDSYYTIETNEGCGGCSSGWSSIELSKGVAGRSIKIKSVSSRTTDYNGKETESIKSDTYNLYINGDIIAKVDTGWGDGYYGGDFEVKICP